MNHNVNQVKVLFEDVRDMYDEDTYQAISVLIDKYLTTGYLSKNEQKDIEDEGQTVTITERIITMHTTATDKVTGEKDLG